jgi:16S rRNA processing protein RimM
LTSSRRAARDGLPRLRRGQPARADGSTPASPPAEHGRPAAPVGQGKLICVARIGAAHGTTGEVRLWPFTAEPAAVGRYGALAAADGRTIEIESLRPTKDFFIARLKGVTDRNGAERLRNVDLFVARDRLPPPAADEYYYADLIGLAAEAPNGDVIGTVIAIHDFGAGDLLEIVPPGGGETMLLPFTAAVVPKVDIAAGRIVLDPPAEIEPDAAESQPRDG